MGVIAQSGIHPTDKWHLSLRKVALIPEKSATYPKDPLKIAWLEVRPSWERSTPFVGEEYGLRGMKKQRCFRKKDEKVCIVAYCYLPLHSNLLFNVKEQ